MDSKKETWRVFLNFCKENGISTPEGFQISDIEEKSEEDVALYANEILDCMCEFSARQKRIQLFQKWFLVLQREGLGCNSTKQ